MNILISGIHGFVGTNLVAALKLNHSIFGLDIVCHEKEGVIRTYAWSEFDAIPQVDVIIHLAGKAHDTKNMTNAQVYFDVNTGLTKKIYDYFLESNASKFIFFSSVKAAADMVVGDFLTEDVIPSPKGPYGESKIAAENYILNQHSVGDKPNKRTYILRPSMIHGPGNKGNLNLLYKVVKQRIPYPLGAFENKRSFTSIDNLVFVIERLLECEIATGIYNVSDDESLSTNELIRLMADTMGKPSRVWKWNKSSVEFFARIGTILHLPLNSERLQKLTENYVVSNNKLKRVFGVEKMPVSASQGFVKTIKSFENKL
jgi:nucleoside-diphosphate-sugar epimerase